MKKTRIRTTISLLLCLVLVLGMAPIGALAAEKTVTGPQLYSSSTEWSSRIDVIGYSDFRFSLQYHLTNELMDPTEDSLLESGDHGILIRKFTGTPTFTYDANAADPAAAAEETAAAAIDAAIAEAGNHDLATVTAYATAIYGAALQDHPAVFWLGSDILVDEVLTYELEYEAGEGTATYTQSFYFYITTADGSFDVRAEDYRNCDETAALYQSLLTAAIDLSRSEELNNRSRYEILQNLNQWLTENNTHHTGSDISHVCRTALSALTDAAAPVSEGYARAFKLICDRKGIPCTLVVGFANGEPHTWCYVQMSDKNWYAVDVALNDSASGAENAKYFLVGSSTVIDGVPFSESHIVTNQLTEGGVAFTNGPQLSESAYTVLPEDISSTAVYVNGKDVRELDDDTITWDEETNTLTLNNASILAQNGTYKGSGIYAVGTDTLILELVGENTVEGKFNGKDVDDLFANAAISTVSGLVIRGDGTLTATDLETGTDDPNTKPYKSAGIYAGGDLTIESGTIHATGHSAQGNYERSAGIIAGDYDSLATLTISGGTVNASGLTRGIVAFDSIRISGGTVNAASSDAAYEYGMGLEVKSLENSDLNTGIHISGGTVTAQGTKYAAYMFLNCSGYENPMWTDTEGGVVNYTAVPSIAGMYSTYLHIEQATYQLVQPTADNHYTVDVETLVGGEYTAGLPEGVTAEYKWYQQHSQAVTAQDVTPPYDGYTLVCTYDEATGLWTFPSTYESNVSYIAFAAEPGETVMLDLLPNEAGMLIIMSGSESMFTASADDVYTYTVTEADMNPETGLFMMAILSDARLQGTLSIASVEEVATAAELPNGFSSDAAGTYFSRVTLTKDGTAVAELQSKTFAYVPVNTVTFDANGGTCDTETAKTQEGLHTLASLPEPLLTGYSFAGWFDAREGGNRITTDTVIMEDITVYAQWTINEYTLTVQGMDGTVYEAQVAYGSDLAAILAGLNLGDITTEDGIYTFTGFALDSGASAPAAMPAEALTVTAVYTYTGWKVCDNGTQYLVADAVQYTGWTQIDGDWYYLDPATGCRAEGVTRVPYPTVAINGITYAPNADDEANQDSALFLFGADGKFLSDTTGIVDSRYVRNGMIPWYPGLLQVDGQYYYLLADDATGGNIMAAGDTAINKNSSDFEAVIGGIYTFGADGILCRYDGITAVNGVLRYYENAQLMLDKGLIQVDGNYYYVRNNGELVVNQSYLITNTNGYPIQVATYDFDENGVLQNPMSPGKNGAYYEKGAWYYYRGGTIAYNMGLLQVTDMVWHGESGEQVMSGVIYVRSNGQLATGTYYVTNVSNFNGTIASGTKLQFDSMGLVNSAKNGIINEGGTLYYYVNNVKQYNAGLIQINGSYYYVRSNGIVAANQFYWITNTNGLKPQGCYEFDASGKMIVSELDGIVEENGIYYYYIDGIKQIGTGVVQLEDGAYIYVRSNGQLATGIYWATNHNGILAEKAYDFGTDGKLYL